MGSTSQAGRTSRRLREEPKLGAAGGRGREPRVGLDRTPPAPGVAPILDAQQQAVVDHRDGHLLVLAGPGTGKTTTLAELVVARVGAGPGRLDASRVLALTFGRKAAAELSERISRRLGGGPVPVVSTFHSFAYGVLRQHADTSDFLTPPRLLTAAEQDARLRELLTYSIREGRLAWPDSLRGAIGTRGIAEQVRALLARARAQGLDGRTLARYGRASGVPVWSSVGRFFEEYLNTLGFEGTLDYAELIFRAVALAGREDEGRALREAYSLVVVDEYQDTDPAQVMLLSELARGGAQVVAVGDPDQAVYGFRGADVRGILTFADTFRDPGSGAPARIEVLRTTRRFPAAIAAAAQGVLGPVPLTGLPVPVQRAHRSPITRQGPASVQARTYPSVQAQAAGAVEVLLRGHAGLDGGPPLDWSQMAVLVRNPMVDGPALARALRGAGIPVVLPPDEIALADEPAVGVLVELVGLALDPGGAPSVAGRRLLGGPLGRAEPVAIRALGRGLLSVSRVPAHGSAGTGTGSSVADRVGDGDPAVRGVEHGSASADALLSAALVEGSLPAGCRADPAVGEAFARVAGALAAVRAALQADATVGEVLWAGWAATDWPDRLRGSALRGGSAAPAANRDLDALVSLFDLANRLPSQRRGRVGVQSFLDEVRSLRIPQETRAQSEVRRDAVRLMSAHRAKGLEWELVVVASVQEGQWPDLRLRSDLLHVNELARGGRVEPRTHREVLAEERRLMYVACTRARSTLVVTAVAEPYEGGLQPSRFLADLGVEPIPAGVRTPSPLDGSGLVAVLRAAACAPEVRHSDGSLDQSVEELREAALARLAALAGLARSGSLAGEPGALAAAHPDRWWGVRHVTGSDHVRGGGVGPDAPGPTGGGPGAGGVPGVADPRPPASAHGDAPVVDPPAVRLSPSAVESLRRCPLQWFLERRVGAGATPGAAAAMGVVLHAVAEALARGELPPERGRIAPFVDGVWGQMPFAARYQRDHERARVDDMIDALLRWHLSVERQVVAAEAPFTLFLAGDEGSVAITGTIDRIDRDAEGRAHVVDFKTGKTAASAQATSENPQLGIYQLAVREGAVREGVAHMGRPGAGEDDTPPLDGGTPGFHGLGGAELVHLADRFASGMPKVRGQAPLPEGRTWVHEIVADAARLAGGPHYPARRNGRCATCAFRHMCPAQGTGPMVGREAPAGGPR